MKATTGEGMGFVGRGEGAAAMAVATLEQRDPASRTGSHARHGARSRRSASSEFRGEDLDRPRRRARSASIEEIYLDAETGEPEWALVYTGLFGTKRMFVPLASATEADGRLRVPLEKETVKDAPGVEPNGQLTED